MTRLNYRRFGERIGLVLWGLVGGLLVGGSSFFAEFVKTLAMAASLSGLLAGGVLYYDEIKSDRSATSDILTITNAQILLLISFGFGLGVLMGLFYS